MSWTIRKPEALEEKLHLLKLNLAKRMRICEGMHVLDVGCGQRYEWR
jgi:cyclopropane fatty-acyl-phospholipid synthase-like methyltransferase